MQVIKEANAELRTLLGDVDNLNEKIHEFTKEELEDFIAKVGELSIRYHERVKEQLPIQSFSELMIWDMKYNFMGGAII